MQTKEATDFYTIAYYGSPNKSTSKSPQEPYRLVLYNASRFDSVSLKFIMYTYNQFHPHPLQFSFYKRAIIGGTATSRCHHGPLRPESCCPGTRQPRGCNRCCFRALCCLLFLCLLVNCEIVLVCARLYIVIVNWRRRGPWVGARC